jgi:hypothetical protein
MYGKNIDRLRITGKEIQTSFLRASSINNENTFMKKLYDNDDIIRISDGLSYEQDSNVILLLQISEKLQQCLIYIALFSICFWLLSSIILHKYYSSYDFMYGYNISLTFLSGYASAILLILLITTSIIFIYILIERVVFRSISDDNKEIEKENKKSNHFWVFLLVFIINLIVMVVVNGLFVSATINKNRNLELFAILVAIFKTVWKSYVLSCLLSILITNDNDNMIDSINSNYSHFNTIFQCSLGILDILIIPLLSTSFLSSNCFYFALIPQPPISSSYLIQGISKGVSGTGVLIPNRDQLTRQSSYQPPF